MWFKDFVEIVFSLGLFINAILFIPQILALVKTKNSEGLSLLTFGGFWLIQLFIIFHGIIKHDKLLVIGYIFSLLTCGSVVFLIIFYRVINKYRKKDGK